MNKNKPEVGHFCEVLYDGRICFAKVTEAREDSFDVITSFKQEMFNIPNDKFKYSPDLGTLIVNMANREYGLNLYTVDAAAMTDDVNKLLQEKKWMIEG